MIQQQVQLGAERFTISGDTLVEVVEQANKFRLMNYRLKGGDDATIRVRKNDGGEFIEMYSPKMKAVKMISKEKETGELYIGADTPWVRYDKENDQTAVRFDVLTDQIANLGWEQQDMGQFILANRCKSEGKKGVARAWTYEPITENV